MKKLNKKAFTLIEILATVTILGILSVVAMVSVNSIIQNAKAKHYTNAEEQLALAGQSYVQQYRNKLPKAIGQKVKIPMQELVNTNYIEQIKDYSDNGCDMKNSYVQVFKYSQNDYSYVAYLECPVYKSTEHLKEVAPNVVLTKKGDTMSATGEKQELVIDINPEGHENTIDVPAKLISYSYIIYRYDKEVKNSGSVALPNYDTRLSKTVDLTPYSPGKLKIVVTATNIYGLTTSKTITSDFKDTTPPTCIIKDVDLPENRKDWTTANRKITVGCEDKNGSGCTREEFTKTFKNSADIDTITIEDNAGNKKQCRVSVYIDITRPTIKVTAYKRTASGGKTDPAIGTMTANHDNPNMTLDLTDVNTTRWLNSISNPNGVYYEVTYSDGESTVKYEAKENAANLLATDSTVNNMTIIDNGQTSGKKLDTKYSTTVDGHRLYTLHASDEIGNYVDLNIITPFDKTPPTTPTLQNPYKQSDGTYKWAIADYSVILTSQDVLSGIESFQYTYKAGATEVTGTNTTGYKKYSDSSASPKELKAFTATPFSRDRNQKYYARACDVAGNCSENVETTVKLDKTKPTCSLSVNLTEIKFSAKSDPKTNEVSSGLADYGLSTSTTASYTEKGSLAFSKTTFYGHVVDVAGNTNTCSRTVFGTSHKYVCSSGTLEGSHCYSYTDATVASGTCSCSSPGSAGQDSYVPNGQQYSATSAANCSGLCYGAGYGSSSFSVTSYSCPNGGTVSGSKCKHDKGNADDVYYCSSGTKLNDSYCYE